MSNLYGNAGVPGATVSYSGQASGSVTADANGEYVIVNAAAGNYTLTPSLAGFTFSPSTLTPTMGSVDTFGGNFTASSGSVASNVTDSRTAPNSTVDIEGTQEYIPGETPSHSPEADSRAAGAPHDSRLTANIPVNSRK